MSAALEGAKLEVEGSGGAGGTGGTGAEESALALLGNPAGADAVEPELDEKGELLNGSTGGIGGFGLPASLEAGANEPEVELEDVPEVVPPNPYEEPDELPDSPALETGVMVGAAGGKSKSSCSSSLSRTSSRNDFGFSAVVSVVPTGASAEDVEELAAGLVGALTEEFKIESDAAGIVSEVVSASSKSSSSRSSCSRSASASSSVIALADEALSSGAVGKDGGAELVTGGIVGLEGAAAAVDAEGKIVGLASEDCDGSPIMLRRSGGATGVPPDCGTAGGADALELDAEPDPDPEKDPKLGPTSKVDSLGGSGGVAGAPMIEVL